MSGTSWVKKHQGLKEGKYDIILIVYSMNGLSCKTEHMLFGSGVIYRSFSSRFIGMTMLRLTTTCLASTALTLLSSQRRQPPCEAM